MTGRGVLYYFPGKPAYDGFWSKGLFQGKGTLHNENPLVLEECFDYNNFNLVEEYWMTYEGEFEEDEKCGSGKLTLSNGESILGQFSRDCVNGRARFTNMEGD